MSGAEAYRRVRAEELTSASKELFEVGALQPGPLDPCYVRRLNTAVFQRQVAADNTVPATLSDAINAKGVLKKHAELIYLGSWLIEGRPGVKPRPGKQADPKKILKCVAAILSEIKMAELKELHSWPARGRVSRNRAITKSDLAEQWKRLFDEKIKASNFDAPLRSARNILSDYLSYLKSGSAVHGGKKIKKSPEITRALKAINGLLPKSHAARPKIFVEPDVPRRATLMPFEIALEYQSDVHAEEHRRLPPGTKLDPRLRYVPQETVAISASGKARADRQGKITLVPDVDIRKDYQVKALIDRMVILVEIRAPTHPYNLRSMLLKQTGIDVVVDDLRNPTVSGNLWGAPLMRPEEAKLKGWPFAILIQEPTPEMLAAILKAIKDGPGLIEPALLHLIEISVDFYPKKPCAPKEAVLRRERMVGLLQRHHWARPSRIIEAETANPRHSDARQIHDDVEKLTERKPKTRYLFASVDASGKKNKHKSDSMIAEEDIRSRVLTTYLGYAPFLNSTVLKGNKFEAHLVSIQNKVTDKRNPLKKVFVTLPDEERRARMEVTISGTETLRKHGLHTLEDLSRISFRKITKDFLRCRLPIIEPVQHIFEDAQVQMKNRGVYGINLRLRALAEERRQALKRAGNKLPRKTKDEEMGLADWQEMNAVIGVALDGLQRRWRKLTIK